MSEFAIVTLILLGIVLLDAIGDGLRWIGKQVAHHMVEILREAIWLSLVAYFMGNWLIIPMYVLARIVFFDPIINLVAGKGLGYIGSSSLYDRMLKWFTHKIGEQGHLIWVVRVLAIIWWIAWLEYFKINFYGCNTNRNS
jgi:hypothetical protein